jgi:hypothetical protein
MAATAPKIDRRRTFENGNCGEPALVKVRVFGFEDNTALLRP